MVALPLVRVKDISMCATALKGTHVLQKLVSARDQCPLRTNRCKLAPDRDFVPPKLLAKAYRHSSASRALRSALDAPFDSAHSADALQKSAYGVSRWQALKAVIWRERCALRAVLEAVKFCKTRCYCESICDQQTTLGSVELCHQHKPDEPSCTPSVHGADGHLLLQAVAEGSKADAVCAMGRAAAESVCHRMHLLRWTCQD